MTMTSTEQDRWLRVKERLRVEVGEDVYSSWFARLELDTIVDDAIKLSVPTRFLKSWIQSHYAEKLLGCWQSEQPDNDPGRAEVRSAAIRPLPPKNKVEPAPVHAPVKVNGHEAATRLPAAGRGRA